jgi:hypothetical protein
VPWKSDEVLSGCPYACKLFNLQCLCSRKVPGSIPGVAGVFSMESDSSTCPGVDSASKNEYQVNPGGKGGRCVRLTTYHFYVPMSRNLGALTSWNPVGLFRPVMGQLYLFLQCLCTVLYCHVWPVWLDHIFLLYLTNGKIFGKKVIEYKMYFDFIYNFYPRHFSFEEEFSEILP